MDNKHNNEKKIFILIINLFVGLWSGQSLLRNCVVLILVYFVLKYFISSFYCLFFKLIKPPTIPTGYWYNKIQETIYFSALNSKFNLVLMWIFLGSF